MSSIRTAVVTLPSDTSLQITRDFDAPKHLVFKAWTTPELIARWWHANRGTVVSIDVDLQVGGSWRYVMTANGGLEVAFRGVYREVVPNERLVHTEAFEAVPGEAVVTTTFTEQDGRTTVTSLVEHANQAERDGHLNSGMEDGMQDALDMLEGVAQSLA
jgi:uncharacterized protein YndB with AHSA1/START domain